MTQETRDELFEELQRVTDELGKSPTTAEFRNCGEFTLVRYYEEFDSWPAALEAAGLDSSRSQQEIPKAKLLNELRRLADEYSEPPTKRQLQKHGKYSKSTYTNRFGSFNSAIKAAGFEPRDPTTAIPEKDLLTELHHLAKKLDRAPTTGDMIEHGKYDEKTYRRRFGSWRKALETADLDPTNRSGERITREGRTGAPTREELLGELRCIAGVDIGANSSGSICTNEGDHNDRSGLDEQITEIVADVEPPSFADVEENARYAASTYVRRFGSFNNAIEVAGFEPRSPPNKIPNEELLAELHRVNEQVKGRVTSTDMDEYGRFSTATYQRRFGSWSDAIEKSEVE